MKLRTEMQDGCVHANGYCVDEAAVELRQAEMLVRDAAAAHALMQSWDALGNEFAAHGVNGMVGIAVLAELERRASEIMAGWGFDSGEAE